MTQDDLISFDEFAAVMDKCDVENKMSMRFLGWDSWINSHIIEFRYNWWKHSKGQSIVISVVSVQ